MSRGVISLALKLNPLRFELRLGDLVGVLPITPAQARLIGLDLLHRAGDLEDQTAPVKPIRSAHIRAQEN